MARVASCSQAALPADILPPPTPVPLPQCFPGQDAARCIKSGAVMAATFGCLFPTIVLRYIEQRSRALFANQLRAAAAHQA